MGLEPVAVALEQPPDVGGGAEGRCRLFDTDDPRGERLPVVAVQESELSRLSTAEKVALLRRLFRGRTDAYPIRWEGKTSGKSGYAPACINEWRAGVCENHPPPALQAGVDAQIAQAEALSTYPKNGS